MIAIVDVQFVFGAKGEAFVKQVSVLDLKRNNTQTFTFKPPQDHSLSPDDAAIHQNKWLEINHHGLNWFHGTINFDAAVDTIREKLSPFTVIFFKGDIKKKYLQKILCHKTLVDLSDLGCPSLKQLLVCKYSKSCVFSVRAVESLRGWLFRK